MQQTTAGHGGSSLVGDASDPSVRQSAHGHRSAVTPRGGVPGTTAHRSGFGDTRAVTRPGPWRLTALALLQLALAVPALVVAVLEAFGAALATVVVGIPLLTVVLPVGRRIASTHRAIAAQVLGTPVPGPYREPPAGAGLVRRLAARAADPLSWRDLAWLLLALPLALLTSLVVVVLLVTVVTGLVWWYAARPLMDLRSRVDRLLLAYGTTELLEQRVEVLTETRAETLDHSDAELRRIERDLHDGAQARLAGLGLTLGLATDLLERDPDAARQVLDEARATTGAALEDLRDLVRGIHPPVLADRGLVAAVQALALDLAVPVAVSGTLTTRPSAPVESAVYFATAECLANVAKHAEASAAWVEMGDDDGVVRVVVGDDGHGGADPSAGHGMQGVARRLAAFDGTMTVSSPAGGPTIVRLEVPCGSSSPRTTPSSGRA